MARPQRPIATVKLDGVTAAAQSIVYTAPPGEGASGVTITFADPQAAAIGTLHAPTRIQVYMGYLTASGSNVDLVFDTHPSAITPGPHGAQFTAERDGDKLVVTAKDLLASTHEIAPEEPEVWPPGARSEEGDFIDFLRFAYGKAGLSVTTNLPKAKLKRREISPSTSYVEAAAGAFGLFEPLVLEQIGAVQLLDPWTSQSGSGLTLRGENCVITNLSSTPYPIVNQVEARISPTLNSDFRLGEDCTGPNVPTLSPETVFAFGDRRIATTTLCGAIYQPASDILVGVDVEFGQDVERQSLPNGEGYVEITNLYATILSDLGQPARTIDIGSITRHWAMTGAYAGELVGEEETIILYLPGTNFGLQSGHITTTRGLVKVPGVATPTFFDPVSVETQYDVYERRGLDGPSDWRKVYSIQDKEGQILVHGTKKVALEVANLNDAVDDTPSTGQRLEYGPITQRSEAWTTSGKGQTNVSVFEFDCLSGAWRHNRSHDIISDRKTSSASSPLEPITKQFKRQSLLDLYKPRKRVSLDCLAFGSSGADVGEWKANQLFNRTGRVRGLDEIRVAGLLTTLYRGNFVDVRDRDGNTVSYLVMGFTLNAPNLTPEGSPTAETIITGLQLNSLTST